MVKRMLKDRPSIKDRSKFIIYSRLKKEIVLNEFGGLDSSLNIEYIQKRESGVVDIASIVKNHFNYICSRDSGNL